MQGNVKFKGIGDGVYGKGLCGFVFVNEREGVARLYHDAVPAHAVCYAHHSAAAHHAHIFHPVHLALVQHRSTNGILPPNVGAAEGQKT